MSDYSSIGYLLGGIGVTTLILLLIVLVVTVGLYVIYALGVRKVLKYFNHKYTWMAFIPLASTVALAQCMREDENGKVYIFGKGIDKKLFIWFPVIQFILAYVPVVGSILSLAIGLVGCVHVYIDLLSRAEGVGEDVTVISWVSAFIGIVWLVMCYTKFKGTEKVKEVVSEVVKEEVAE